ncbi:MAG: hypothetical protein ACM35G_07855, partial [Planctomycetaceae bacterium]
MGIIDGDARTGRDPGARDRRARPVVRHEETKTMSMLTDFYRGLGTDNEGRTLAEIWSFTDE